MRAKKIRLRPPITRPRRSWLTAAEVNEAPPSSANNESEAEVNIRSPETNSAHTTKRNGASMDFFIPSYAVRYNSAIVMPIMAAITPTIQ